MLRPACLCLLALPLAIPSLAAQSLIQRPTQVPLDQLRPEAFRQRIAGSAHHVLVVVQGQDPAWNRRMEALIADPEVQALDLWVVRLAPTSPLAQGWAGKEPK